MKKIMFTILGLTVFFGIISCVVGLLSFNTDHSFNFVNQYGETIKIWGYGIYKNDSFFKAPIFIGSDFTMLFVTIPLLIRAIFKYKKLESQRDLIFLTSMLAALLYFSFSQAFGITYNQLHLIYIAFFGFNFYSFVVCLYKIKTDEVAKSLEGYSLTKTIKVFLVLAGLSLFVAWLPDIIVSLVSGKPLSLLEVYTTDITYVLDMSIISPFIFITLFLLKSSNNRGYVFLPIVLVVCSVVGIMVIFQSIYQYIAGIHVPIPALITKVGIFVALSVVSFNLSRSYFKSFTNVNKI